MLGGSAGLVYGLPVGGVAGQVCCCVPRVQRPPRRRSPTLDAAAVCRSFCQQSSPLDLGFLLVRDVGSQNHLNFYDAVARYPQATLPKEAERIVHAAMPEPVAAVAVAVVNSTLADVANAVPATATAVVRSSVEALVVASRPSSVEDASASDTGSGRRGPVQAHGPL